LAFINTEYSSRNQWAQNCDAWQYRKQNIQATCSLRVVLHINCIFCIRNLCIGGICEGSM